MTLLNLVKPIALRFLKYRLKKKFGREVHINRSSIFEGYNFLSHHVKFVSSSIGYASYISSNSKISNTHIGRYTSIGPSVHCIFGKHPSSTFVSTHPSFFSTRKQSGFSYTKAQLFKEFADPVMADKKYTISIGNDVWIGANVNIMDGITIGDGAIVAAGAMVIKDVEPYSIVGGVPAKLIKYRFPEEQRKFLLQFKWWDKEEKWIRENASAFVNIESFFETFKK